MLPIRSLTALAALIAIADTPAGQTPASGGAADAIPIEARVVAACDAFGAMTSDRPWRRGLEHEDAIAELRRVAGSQLDPDVASAVCDAVDDGRQSSPLRGAA